jgi:hypothetical protein
MVRRTRRKNYCSSEKHMHFISVCDKKSCSINTILNFQKRNFIIIIHLFTCAYIVWVISCRGGGGAPGGGAGARGEKWPKPCRHIWIIIIKNNKLWVTICKKKKTVVLARQVVCCLSHVSRSDFCTFELSSPLSEIYQSAVFSGILEQFWMKFLGFVSMLF